MSDFDSPWKEALERFLPAFLAFFFPESHGSIDWERGYESLDTELQQVAREGELGRRLADKLFRVWRRDGEEAWVLIHVEVQSQTDEEFAERMYVYNYRLYDRFRRPVVSLAVLGDCRKAIRTSDAERRTTMWHDAPRRVVAKGLAFLSKRINRPAVRCSDEIILSAWFLEPELNASAVFGPNRSSSSCLSRKRRSSRPYASLPASSGPANSPPLH